MSPSSDTVASVSALSIEVTRAYEKIMHLHLPSLRLGLMDNAWAFTEESTAALLSNFQHFDAFSGLIGIFR